MFAIFRRGRRCWLILMAAASFLLAFTESDDVFRKYRIRYADEIFSKIADPLEATRAYYRALEQIQLPTEANFDRLKRLEGDIEDILSAQDREKYKTLPTHTARAKFILYFWRREDVTPATEINERLIEHYQRLAFVRKAFPAFNKRGYDDRGAIYVKYGPPDDRILTPESGYYHAMETWAYYKFGKPITFDFIEKGDGYRLAMRFDEGVKVGDQLSRWQAIGELLDRRKDLSTTWLAMRSAWDQYQYEPISMQRKLMLLDQVISEQCERILVAQKQLPITTTDIFKDEKPLPFTARAAWFRDSQLQHAFLLYYSVQRKDILNADEARLRCRAAIKWPDQRLITSAVDSIAVPLANGSGAEVISGGWQFHVGPGSYILALELDNPAGPQYSSKTFIAETGPTNVQTLQISSVVFASRIDSVETVIPGSIVRKGLRILPIAVSELPANRAVYLYFELYNLQVDGKNESFFEMEYTVERTDEGGIAGFFRTINPFAAKKDRISLKEVRREKGAIRPVYFRFDFQNLLTGQYTLTVRAKDNYANIVRERQVKFKLL